MYQTQQPSLDTKLAQRASNIAPTSSSRRADTSHGDFQGAHASDEIGDALHSLVWQHRRDEPQKRARRAKRESGVRRAAL
eukprot:4016017-Pleurochrysis_carterae.AAC.2